MKNKKVTIIGRGTVGCLTAMHFSTWLGKDYDIDWLYSENIPTQSVGEGTTSGIVDSLYKCLGFKHENLLEIDGTFKYGILKRNWSTNKDFTHHFPGSSISYHFNALKLQEYIFRYLKRDKRLKQIEGIVENSKIDSDYIIDCSGAPKDYSSYTISESIPVNSVYVEQCYWNKPEFFHTLAIARPHGWVFSIPLTNRCSVGYMYNNAYANLEDIKLDIEQILIEYNLISSGETNSISFKNYYKQNNFMNNICYNGNASFFLEPLEASSLMVAENVNRIMFDHIHGVFNIEQCNNKYHKLLTGTESMIMLHYLKGSVYDNGFWQYAKQRAENNIQNNTSVDEIIQECKLYQYKNQVDRDLHVGGWAVDSWQENIIGLGVTL